jgi:hypothetical protein
MLANHSFYVSNAEFAVPNHAFLSASKISDYPVLGEQAYCHGLKIEEKTKIMEFVIFQQLTDGFSLNSCRSAF